jgi:hypothetical protein
MSDELMNLMNFDEPFLALWRVNLFCIWLSAGFFTKQNLFCKNGVFWFIKVHQVHKSWLFRQIVYELMNLMNFDELVCCVWLSFAMCQKGNGVDELGTRYSSSSKFIKFINPPWHAFSAVFPPNGSSLRSQFGGRGKMQ